jgi:hypothetical protein
MRRRTQAACWNHATSGAATARKAPATQSFQALKFKPETKTPSASSQHHASHRVAIDQAAYVADVEEIHRNEDGRPLAKLSRNHRDPPAPRMAPTRDDAEKRGYRGQNDPIGRRRSAKEGGAEDANQAKDDDRVVGNFGYEAGLVPGPARFGGGIRSR